MVKHRDQAKFDRAGWRLRVLLPCWITQISLLLVLIGTSAYLFAHAIEDSIEVRATAIAWECINIGISVISVLLTAYEIFRTMTEVLTPKTMLVTNLVKLGGIVLSMIMDGMVTGTSLNAWSDGTLVIHSLLVISVLYMGSYAAWKWKRLAQYDDYHLPGNVNPYGFKSDMKKTGKRGLHSHVRILSEDLDWDPDLEMGNSVEIIGNASPGGGAAVMAPSPGEPTPTTPEPFVTRERGSSFTNLGGRKIFSMGNDPLIAPTSSNADDNEGTRSRANSGSALMAVDTAYDPAAEAAAASQVSASSSSSSPPPPAQPTLPQRPASYISITGSGVGRRASYNHARDTSFDEYVANQQKQKRRVSQRMSLGSNSSWTSSSPPNNSNRSSAASGSSPVTSPPASRERSSSGAAANKRSSRADSLAAYRLSLNLKSDIDDALSAEFGWGSHSRSSSQDSIMVGGQPGAIAVGGGAVQNVKSVRDSIGRAPSDGSERGALGIVPEGPEDDNRRHDGEDEDEEAGDSRRRRRQNVDEASRALLGESSMLVPDHQHPELLRPGRPKSEQIAFVVTPPPKSPVTSVGARGTWGSAYSRY